LPKILRLKPNIPDLFDSLGPIPGWLSADGQEPAADSSEPAADPVPVCSLWAAESFDFWPDRTQESLLDGSEKRLLLLTTRQWGKSTVAAIRALWQALFFPGSLILIVGPVANQSCELTRKIYHFAGRLGIPLHGGGAGQRAAVFPNGSRIVGLSEMPENVRGYSAPSLILIDEAAFYDGDEILESIFPMLATQPAGVMWIMSSSGRQTGFFYNLWSDPSGPWRKVKVSAVEHQPGVFSRAKEAEPRKVPPRVSLRIPQRRCGPLQPRIAKQPTQRPSRAFMNSLAAAR
jgi:hypothetical protein